MDIQQGPVKLVVDFTPAIRQTAGIGRIIRGQMEGLSRSNPGYRVSLFVSGQVDASERARAAFSLHSFPLISERNLTRLWHRLALPIPRVEWLTGGGIDLFHATDFVLAPVSARRKLLTVHDLAFVRFPETAMPSLQRYLNVVVPRSIGRADHLIADSHHTARDLEELRPDVRGRVSVVQGAVDHGFFAPVTDVEALRAARERYGIDEQRPFLLALSTLQPRKNFTRLIRAFHAARQEAGLPHQLVIGGRKGWLFTDIFATVRELGLEGDVLFPGFVADGDLPALFSAAEFFVYPSLYEGFGLPVLEAMACGTAVLTADNSCLPEAGGDGALYVDAESEESIADGIVQLATCPRLRARLIAAGRRHARAFTWERTADQLLAAYDLALA